MSLRYELEEILTEQARNNPTWRQMAEGETTIEVSGPLNETFQTVTNALMTYSDALLKMVLRLADAVDELRGDAEVEDDKTA